MITPRPSGSGTVVTTLGSATPTAALLSIHDESGRLVVRRRFHERRLHLTLPAGPHTFTVEDERSLHDPRRLAGTSVTVDVSGDGSGSGSGSETELTLVPGAAIQVRVAHTGVAARFARVRAAHRDGQVIETRTDGRGLVALCGLRAGTWTVEATDCRRTRCATPQTLTVHAGRHGDVLLDLACATSDLLVRVRGAGLRAVSAESVVATGADGVQVSAPRVGGQALLRGLRPGTQTITVAASVGHLVTEVVVAGLAPGTLSVVEAVVPVGASVSGRVVGDSARGGQHAAVVTLVDADGIELERVRTDDRGRFVIGRGLGTLAGLSVVATSGPETLHVTRAARADLATQVGVRLDVGQIALPSVGRAADWTPYTRAIAAMKLPSTRV